MKKALIWITASFLFCYLLWVTMLWSFFSHGFAGSYPYVETWQLKGTQSEVIRAIRAVKNENPQLQDPLDTALTIGQDSYWYFINFYYPDTKETVHTWIQEDGLATTLAFDALSTETPGWTDAPDSLSAMLETNRVHDQELSFRHINNGDDFGYFANKREIRKFEREIVDRIREKLETDRQLISR